MEVNEKQNLLKKLKNMGNLTGRKVFFILKIFFKFLRIFKTLKCMYAIFLKISKMYAEESVENIHD